MSGMLPGVEAARRRRCHQTNNNGNSELFQTTIRRSSFCLYAGGHHLNATPSKARNFRVSQQAACDESSLGSVAREAKKRLDERLQQQWRSVTMRTLITSQHKLRTLEDKPTFQAYLQRGEVNKLKKSGSKRLNWFKLNCKSSEQEECAVCLERFKARRGESLMQLPCGHKFHTNCLVPWLDANAHCPCCRMEISSSNR